MKKISREILDSVYNSYNKRELVSPDPLEFLFAYKHKKDREIAGLIAASLAYGRVAQILKSVSSVLSPMGASPYSFIDSHAKKDFKKIFSGFKHRFTTDSELADFLHGIKITLSEYGSLEACFDDGYKNTHETVHEALTGFAAKLKKPSGSNKSSLLPDPALKSACKRLHLFLRWMIRSDEVDPGGWKNSYTPKLIVPLDTHMYHFGKFYGFTSRAGADILTALEITSGFRRLCPDDPVKYDFALTRFGRRNELNWEILDGIMNDFA
ncbi:MAG: TIGR02757 family protein [Spirochaetia bacterium]|jgi:uncharacterized protein (TIGR02757 family)|nr:TIGR02757 family protein [Spirochaetia bacterium]